MAVGALADPHPGGHARRAELMIESVFAISVLFALNVLGLGGAGYGLSLASVVVGGVIGSLTANRIVARLVHDQATFSARDRCS